MTLNKFWLYIITEYPEMSKKSRTIHLPFSILYLCKQKLSAFTNVKTKIRELIWETKLRYVGQVFV